MPISGKKPAYLSRLSLRYQYHTHVSQMVVLGALQANAKASINVTGTQPEPRRRVCVCVCVSIL